MAKSQWSRGKSIWAKNPGISQRMSISVSKNGRTTRTNIERTAGKGAGRGSGLRFGNAISKGLGGSVRNSQRNPKRSVKKGMK